MLLEEVRELLRRVADFLFVAFSVASFITAGFKSLVSPSALARRTMSGAAAFVAAGLMMRVEGCGG